MTSSRWSDTFLDQLRQQCDPLADQSLSRLMEDGELQNTRKVFSELDSNIVEAVKLFAGATLQSDNMTLVLVRRVS